jgi:hypothetical protein
MLQLISFRQGYHFGAATSFRRHGEDAVSTMHDTCLCECVRLFLAFDLSVAVERCSIEGSGKHALHLHLRCVLENI